MKWSIKLGRLWGIDVYVHFTFLLILGFVAVSHWLMERSLGAALSGVGFFLAIFVCVLLHEYGHSLMARRFGIQTSDITLLPIGGLARLERMPDKPSQELWVALAGPAVNVVIAIALSVWLTLSNSWEPVFSLTVVQGSFAERLLAVNCFLVLFNLIPAFPMDGGRVLRAVMAMRMEHHRATQIAANIGQGIAVIFAFCGLFASPMLLFIALFVWIGASQEASAAASKSTLSGVLVREAMLTDVKTLTPDDIVEDATRLLLAGSQHDFPVMVHGRVIGLLLRDDLIDAIRSNGQEVPVSEIMKRDFTDAHPNELLDTAMANNQHGNSVPVMLSGKLVGLLTAENIGELLMIRRAMETSKPKRAT